MRTTILLAALAVVTLSSAAQAKPAAAAANSCASLPDHDALLKALKESRAQANGGLNLDMWGTIVDRTGVVCAVAYTGETIGSQWPGSRLISMTKAATANDYSLDGMALSTANMYAGAQPGGFLYGIMDSNPVNQAVAYKGPASAFGSAKDPAVGGVVGGSNVFGGGLALYSEQGKVVGGLGVSGDTSCADHNIAWRTRGTLKLDYVTNGVSPDKNDQIIYDLSGTKSKSGFGQPTCGNKEDDVASHLPPTRKTAVAESKDKPKE